MNIKKMNKGLDFLREKYGAAKGEITLKDGHCYVGATPLLPGRMERKIVELKKMTESGTEYAVVLTNNGKQPKGEIEEGGGLSGLRTMTENVGGRMTVESVPNFVLTITVPKEMQKNE